jgi:hypothetical protein
VFLSVLNNNGLEKGVGTAGFCRLPGRVPAQIQCKYLQIKMKMQAMKKCPKICIE